MQTNTEHEEDDPDLGKLIGETGISNKARSKGTNQDASEQIARDWRDLQTMSECAHQKSHDRSEEHTSELQSLMRTSYAVFCLKKKKQAYTPLTHTNTESHIP